MVSKVVIYAAVVVPLCATSSGCGRVAFDRSTDAGTDAAADPATDAAAGPTLVQHAGGAANPAANLSATFIDAPVVGHVLVLVGAGHAGPLATPVGGSSAWALAAHSAIHANLDIWFGPADGSTTITIDAGMTTGYTLWVGEWSGLASAETLDTATAQSGTSSPATAGTITTSGDGELVIFAVNDFIPNTFGAPQPGTWTELDTQGVDSMQTVWMTLAPSPGPVAPAVTETRNSWDAGIAAFRAQ